MSRIAIATCSGLCLVASLGAIDFAAGPGVWQEDTSYLFTAEVGIFAENDLLGGKLYHGYKLPLLVTATHSPYTTGVNTFLSEPLDQDQQLIFAADRRYLAAMLDRFYFARDKWEVGTRRLYPYGVGRGQLAVGDPLRHGRTPYLGSNAFIANDKGGLVSSSLIKPSFSFGYYAIQPTTDSPNFVITPLAWSEFLSESSPQHYGGGLEMQTGGLSKPGSRLGTVWSYSYISQNENMYRATGGLWWELWALTIEGGAVVKSANHPLFPYLTDLYPGRRLVAAGNDTSTSAGGYLSLLPPKGSKVGFELGITGQFTQPVLGALRVGYRHEVRNLIMRFVFLKEDIEKLTDLNQHHRSDAFIGWIFSTPLTAEKLIVEWETYQHWYIQSRLKSRIWISIRF